MCHMSNVTGHVSLPPSPAFLLCKVLELVGCLSFINGANPSSFKNNAKIMPDDFLLFIKGDSVVAHRIGLTEVSLSIFL